MEDFMARAKTKKDLFEQSQGNFDKLLNFIKEMDDDIKASKFDFKDVDTLKGDHWKRDQNISDVLTHIYAWHQLLISWVNKNVRAIKTPFIPLPYTFKTYGQLNMKYNEKYKNTALDEAIKMVKMSHLEVMHIIKSFTDEILFTPAYFTWTGTTSLGSYCVSATASHYDWAFKKLEKHVKSYKEKGIN
jgi:hypothetical protein